MSPAPTRPDPAISPTPNSPSSADVGARLAGDPQDFRRADGAAVLWQVAEAPVDYAEAVAAMERHADAIAGGLEPERVWLVEHPPLYTAGSGVGELPASARFPVHRTGRGGQVTYHGPGQRVAYVMLDLSARRRDVRGFVAALERWIVDALETFAIRGERRADRVGVWVRRPDKPRGAGGEQAEDKIAAIGIRLRRWVSFHGVALNVEPDLSHYAGIVPCGIAGAHLGQTSLVDLGHVVTMAEVDAALRHAFEDVFGQTSERFS